MKITSPRRAHQYLKNKFRHDVEEFWVLALDAEKKLIASDCLFRGTVNQCMCHPRDVFRFAVKHNAVTLVIAHNHPSGNPEPSEEDNFITAKMVGAGLMMEIPIVDHIICAGDKYVSCADRGEVIGEREIKRLEVAGG